MVYILVAAVLGLLFFVISICVMRDPEDREMITGAFVKFSFCLGLCALAAWLI